jgi:RNA 3'-terminal phosphate cyclase (ATP)
MLTIDGRHGEGGGQILRSSLSLAGLTGQAVQLHHIRGGRAKPGLMRQHLTAVKAAARVCAGHVDGAELGSQDLTFTPGIISGGDYHFAIGSGGSACLVLQTLLPMLLRAPEASRVVVEGGTHNPMAPVFDFLHEVFAPQLWAMGAGVRLQLERAGFMSTGGGQIIMEVQPATEAHPLDLCDRGKATRRVATVHQSGLPFSVAKREWDVVHKRFGHKSNELKIQDYKEASGPGNAITLTQHFERVSAMCTGMGAIGKRAEKVAQEACDEMQTFLEHDAPVCEHLADQLLLPMAVLAGGSFRTASPSEHTRTNRDVLGVFLGAEAVTITDGDDGIATVSVAGGRLD